jgi:Transposase DDE domain/Domain of unknown function (DUF4372)
MKRFCSIMSQLLQIFPRTEFEEEVQKTKAERHARGFESRDHFVAMLYCQLADAQSLREIAGGLASCEGRLEQWGIRAPKKSTLSYANQHRPWQLFQNVYYRTFERCRAELGMKTKFRFSNRLLSIDSSVVTLCSEMFPWATWSRQKGAVKLHVTLDHAGYMPEAMVITTGKYSELTVARRRRYTRGTILVMDRGFVHFGWFRELTNDGVWFVTRAKKGMSYQVVESKPVAAGTVVHSDERIQLISGMGSKAYPDILRLVTITTEEGETLQFLTNNMTLAAATVAEIYKDRWQIETFFKLIKQNLRIKTFVGTSANAVWTQIWTALIAMMVIKYLQLKARHGWSFSNLVYFLRMNLLVYRDLWAWLDNPFTPEPPSEVTASLPLQAAMPWAN